MSKIAYIQAGWHTDITDNCKLEFTKVMEKNGYDKNIDFFIVPGSLEIPLTAKLLAKSGKYQAIATSGFIVNGGIYRHDFVSSTVIDAIMQIQLETEVPIFSAILTPINFHEHEAHVGFFTEHMKLKGEELGNAVLSMLDVIKKIK